MAKALAVDRNDIKSVGYVGRTRLLKVVPSRSTPTGRLSRGDGRLGAATIPTRLDLDENENFAIKSDKIEFATMRGIPPSDQRVARFKQVLRSAILRDRA